MVISETLLLVQFEMVHIKDETIQDVGDITYLENEKKYKVILEGDGKRKVINNCDQCDYESKSAREIKSHVLTAHKGVILQCKFCSLIHDSKGEIPYHMQRFHKDMSCTSCGELCKGEINLNGHKLRMHAKIKTKFHSVFACDQCFSEFKTTTGLKLHIQNKHDKIKYSCDQCEFTASQKGHIIRHKKVRHEGFRVSCQSCNYTATGK